MKNDPPKNGLLGPEPWHGSSRGMLVVAALCVLLSVASRTLADFDLPWHLAHGRELFQTHSVPKLDDFGLEHGPVRYIPLLADGLLYAVYRVGGLVGLQAANGVVGMLLGAGLLLAAGGWSLWSLGFAFLGLLGVSPWLNLRPSTLSFVAWSLELLLLQVHATEVSGRQGRWALVGVVALMVFWCNLHGSAPLGAVLMGAYLVTRWAARGFGRDGSVFLNPSDGRDLLAPGLAFLGSVGALGLNPWGWDALRLSIFTATEMPKTLPITEWAPTSWDFFVRQSPWSGVALTLSLLGIALGRDEASGSRSLRSVDVVGVALAMALMGRVRMVPYAIVVLAPLAAKRLRAAFPDTHRTKVAGWALVAMLPPALVGTSDAPSGLGFDERHFPEPALRHVEETALQGPPWNFSPFGGYMIWRLYPRHRVLMDGRIMTAYSMPLVEKAMASDVHPDAFHELDAKYHFEWALCWAGETGTGPGCLPIANSKQWTMTFWDDLSAVYVRRKGSNEAAAREGYRLLRHNVPPEQVLAASIEGGPQSNELVQDATLATRQAPTSPRAWFFAACAAIATRNEEQFETAKQKISTLRPGHASIEALDAAFRMAREKK